VTPWQPTESVNLPSWSCFLAPTVSFAELRKESRMAVAASLSAADGSAKGNRRSSRMSPEKMALANDGW
jgi:hypothetical protein